MSVKFPNAAEQFPKHLSGIGNGADGRAFIVIPFDRNLTDSVTIPSCEIENFDIEGKSLYLQLRKKGFAPRPR